MRVSTSAEQEIAGFMVSGTTPAETAARLEDLIERKKEGAPDPLKRENAVAPVDWSADNRYLIFGESAGSAWDLWIQPLEGDKTPIPYLRNGSRNFSARLSPDGRWLAYVSRDASGASLFVQGFPKPGRRWLADTGNQIDFVLGWSGKGAEVLWTTAGRRTVSAATVRASEKDEQATVATGAPRVVYRRGPSTNRGDTLIGRGANGYVYSSYQQFNYSNLWPGMIVLSNWRGK